MQIGDNRQSQDVDPSCACAFQYGSRRRGRRPARDNIINQNYGFSRDCRQFAGRNPESARHISAALGPRQADLMRRCAAPDKGKRPDGLSRSPSDFDGENLCLVEAAVISAALAPAAPPPANPLR